MFSFPSLEYPTLVNHYKRPISYSLTSWITLCRLPICSASSVWWYEYSWQCGSKTNVLYSRGEAKPRCRWLGRKRYYHAEISTILEFIAILHMRWTTRCFLDYRDWGLSLKTLLIHVIQVWQYVEQKNNQNSNIYKAFSFRTTFLFFHISLYILHIHIPVHLSVKEITRLSFCKRRNNINTASIIRKVKLLRNEQQTLST